MRVEPRPLALLPVIAALVSALVVLVPVVLPPSAAAGATGVAERPGIVIDEVSNGGPAGPSDGFFELRNTTSRALDLSGWSVYRCDEEGLRAKLSRPEVDLTGVVVGPGDRFTVRHMSHQGAPSDAVFTEVLPATGFGLVLLDPYSAVVDAVAVYANAPEPTQTECAPSPNLPVTLGWALGESWQRTPAGWVRATATPGAPNVGRAEPSGSASVRLDEIAAAGPAGHGDDFVELRNAGTQPQRLDGWRLYRCTADGTMPTEALQHRFGSADVLAVGGRLVVGGPEFVGEPDVRTATSLADLVSGAVLIDADGRRVDGVSVSSRGDTACQSDPEPLPAALDYRTGESWQRQADGGFVIGTRTPGWRNVTETRGVAAAGFGYPRERGVALSELAADPAIAGVERHHFVEVANYGDHRVDVSGWRLIACGSNGFRRFDDLAVVAAGTVLAPGETWVAALTRTAAAGSADAVFHDELELSGFGVWLEDDAGRRVDSAGVFHRNEMDDSIEVASPCTKGLSLPTFGVDRLRGETWQRARFTGDDDTDFVREVATPGAIDRRAAADPYVVAATALDEAMAAVPARSADSAAASAPVTPAEASGPTARVLAAWTGSADGPLTARRIARERSLDPAAELSVRDDGYAFPHLRLRVEAEAEGVVGWSGRTVGRAEVRLSVWNPDASAWRTLDVRTGAGPATSGAADQEVALRGRLARGEAEGGVAELLVQVVPRATSPAEDAAGIAAPDDYDVAISHLTDTQYYSEAYPEVYASQVAWIAANAEPRKIAFATHTGDLVQNWVDPDQREERARREFATASEMQRVLDDAGVPNSVLPGNHDNKRGVSNDLFNEYFPPERYEDRPWYGASIAAGDNSASWSSFTAGGAEFVMISLPYAYGEREIAWAEEIVGEHDDANVVISTHEHLTPKSAVDDPERSTSSRWLSRGDVLWERVVAPHRNVVLVLSGHFHGIGAVVTHDAGGLAGHTVLEALADYQEFRTHTGERATGFQRLLQVDLAAGVLAVDTFSPSLGATASHPYDYRQFVPDNGHDTTASAERPWRILERGLQHRYTEADDEFAVRLRLQYAKALDTQAVTFAPADAEAVDARGPARRLAAG
ncbi:metallophosphoesterase [Microbacterium sp. NPDC057407]|uniref:metallophosphoesterase n=1 Tax=Microbacterium sp. NPDC057407 TaxID=3346120 RepID=UPI00367228BB